MRYAAIDELLALTEASTSFAEVIALQRDGKTVGYFFPAPQRNEAGIREDIVKLREAIARVREETGLAVCRREKSGAVVAASGRDF
jgi:propanediol dehydratase large subunit